MSKILVKRRVKYAKRESRTDGSVLSVSKKKVLCDKEGEHKFYLKIGGIFVHKKTFKDDLLNGIVLSHKNRSTKMTIHLVAKNPITNIKFSSYLGSVGSVIPRCDSTKGNIIYGLRIDDRHQVQKRGWTGEVDTNDAELYGFEEFGEDYDYDNELKTELKEDKSEWVSIYVNEKTTVLMLDTSEGKFSFETAVGVHTDKQYHQRTVLQSGAFVIMKAKIAFRFLEIPTDQFLLTDVYVQNLVQNKTDLQKNIGNNPILFLSETTGFHWMLNITKYKSRTDGRRVFELMVPTGGSIEKIMGWSEGLEEVKRRHQEKPWNKYIEVFRKNVDNVSRFRDIDINSDEEYPDDRPQSGVTDQESNLNKPESSGIQTSRKSRISESSSSDSSTSSSDTSESKKKRKRRRKGTKKKSRKRRTKKKKKEDNQTVPTSESENQ